MTALATEPTPTETPAAPAPAFHAVVNRDDILTALATVNGYIPKRVPVPALEGVKLTADRGVLTVRRTNYETDVRATVVAPGAAGETVLDATALHRALRALAARSRVSFARDGEHVSVVADGVVYRVTPLPLDEHPAELDVTGMQRVVETDGATLRRITSVAAAAGGDWTLPVLCGVHLSVLDGRLSLAATDRYRLAIHDTDIPADLHGAEAVLVPVDVLRKAAATFSRAQQVTIDIDRGRDHVVISDGSRRLVTRTLDGQFPRVRTLLAEPDLTFAVDAAELAAAVDRASALTGPTHPLLLKGMHIESTSGDDHALARVSGTWSGTPRKVGFNPVYLRAAIAHVGGPIVHLGFHPRVDAIGQQAGPVAITSPSAPGVTHLVMPVRRDV